MTTNRGADRYNQCGRNPLAHAATDGGALRQGYLHPSPRVNPWIIAVTVMLAQVYEVPGYHLCQRRAAHHCGQPFRDRGGSHVVLTRTWHPNCLILPMAAGFHAAGPQRFYMMCVNAVHGGELPFCGIAPTLGLLIVFRVAAGKSARRAAPISRRILVENVPREKQGMAMALYGWSSVLLQ